MIIVHRTSPLTGISHSMEVDITLEQLKLYESGEKVHKAFPNLNAGQREFILSGITPEEWDEAFGNSEED